MLKKAYCEEFTGKYSASIRLAVALELVKKHKFTQLQAARTVKIPQPLLNYVIHGKRKPRFLDMLLSDNRALSIIENLADQIANGKTLSMCDFCKALKNIVEEYIASS